MDRIPTKARKEQITKVAQNMFRERGYPATSMRDLANEVGVMPASLYNHIKSKEEILEKICFGIAEDFFSGIKNLMNEDIAADEKLRKAITSHVEVIKNNADASAVFFLDWRHLSEPKLSEFKELRNSYENVFKSIIKEGIEKGVFSVLDEKVTVLTIFSAMNWTYNWYKTSKGFRPKEISDSLSNLILNGLIKKS